MEITSTSDMRKFLLDQMVKVAAGKLEVAQARAVGNLAQQVYNTAKLEMQFAALKMKEGVGEIAAVEWKQKPQQRLNKK